jgi:hypothetical protein
MSKDGGSGGMPFNKKLLLQGGGELIGERGKLFSNKLLPQEGREKGYIKYQN